MAKGVSKLLCGLTACFVFLDPVPSIPVEQQHQKTIVSAVPPSPVGDVRPSTHVAPLEKPCEPGVSGESCFLFSGITFPAWWRRSAFPCFSMISGDQAYSVVKCCASI